MNVVRHYKSAVLLSRIWTNVNYVQELFAQSITQCLQYIMYTWWRFYTTYTIKHNNIVYVINLNTETRRDNIITPQYQMIYSYNSGAHKLLINGKTKLVMDTPSHDSRSLERKFIRKRRFYYTRRTHRPGDETKL